VLVPYGSPYWTGGLGVRVSVDAMIKEFMERKCTPHQRTAFARACVDYVATVRGRT
jgi:hypothetical protein